MNKDIRLSDYQEIILPDSLVARLSQIKNLEFGNWNLDIVWDLSFWISDLAEQSEAEVAEFADALGSGPSPERGRGSTPLLGIFDEQMVQIIPNNMNITKVINSYNSLSFE